MFFLIIAIILNILIFYLCKKEYDEYNGNVNEIVKYKNTHKKTERFKQLNEQRDWFTKHYNFDDWKGSTYCHICKKTKLKMKRL